MWKEQTENYGVKFLSATKSIGEVRGYDEQEMSTGANTLKQKSVNLMAELEWATDTAGAISYSTFKESEQFKYLEKDGGLPTTDLTPSLKEINGEKFLLTDATTAQCFNNRGVIQGPDHKSWTVTPLADRWYTFNPDVHDVFPYWQPTYKPTSPQDEVQAAPAHRDFDVAAVYLRVKQLDPKIKTSIRAFITTKLDFFSGAGNPLSYRPDLRTPPAE